MAGPADKAKDKAATKGLTAEEKQGCSKRTCEGCKPIDSKNTQSSDYQDRMYNYDKDGNRMSKPDAPIRVKNFSKSKGWACTICGRYEGTGPKK